MVMVMVVMVVLGFFDFLQERHGYRAMHRHLQASQSFPSSIKVIQATSEVRYH